MHIEQKQLKLEKAFHTYVHCGLINTKTKKKFGYVLTNKFHDYFVIYEDNWHAAHPSELPLLLHHLRRRLGLKGL